MRYKRGTKVEVFRKSDVPSGSWHGAEMISGDGGHTYTVRYDMYVGTNEGAVVERVSRKFIRPTPPALETSENWVSGDIVEVFDNFCWKMATISKVLGTEYFLVRAIGSTREFKVNKVCLRVRLSWQDNKWFVIGKVSRSCEEGNQTEQSTLKCHQISKSRFRTTDALMNPLVTDDVFAVKEKMHVHNTQNSSSRTLKRRLPFHDSPIKAYTGAPQKFRLTDKEGRHDRVIATANPTSLPDTVDAVASSREKHKRASLNNKARGFSEMDAKRLKQNGAEPNDADRVACSVGSCSVSSNILYELPHHSSTRPVEDDNFSDAESLCWVRNEEADMFLPSKEELAEEIHNLELHAYQCTMEALHASGPLSWEQESMVTNLRLSLHISNDEHLMELRNLVSTTETSIRIK